MSEYIWPLEHDLTSIPHSDRGFRFCLPRKVYVQLGDALGSDRNCDDAIEEPLWRFSGHHWRDTADLDALLIPGMVNRSRAKVRRNLTKQAMSGR